MTGEIGFLREFAARRGLRYEADADERWLRAWEPYATLKTPVGYVHALHATGQTGSVSVARFIVPDGTRAPSGEVRERNISAWIAIAQDVRITARAAATNEREGYFRESLDLVTLPRGQTGDAPFDSAFAAFADPPSSLATVLTPSVRKLATSWRTPLHFELRPGGFILAPVALPMDEASLAWLFDAVYVFGEKAVKMRTSL